jgi:hypothetical protein
MALMRALSAALKIPSLSSNVTATAWVEAASAPPDSCTATRQMTSRQSIKLVRRRPGIGLSNNRIRNQVNILAVVADNR